MSSFSYSRRHLCLISLVAVLLVAFAGPASAQTLYTNGPVNGELNAFTVNSGYAVSDSFILTGAYSTLSGVDFGVWSRSGESPQIIDWSIGSSTFGTDVASGTGAALTSSMLFNNDYGYEIDQENFSLPSINLGPGTYWLTLQNATASGGIPLYWDEDNGPSAAFQTGPEGVGALANYDLPNTTGSEAFQIYGPNGPSPTPEPGTLSLLGTGLFFLLPLSLRRRIKSTDCAV